MNQYKICVYAICKNEEAFVDRWMDAVSEADLVVVTDTGSTDNTVQKLRERGAIVYTEAISPWRFDRARNLAMDHIPDDVDICVSNDLDEVFEPGWRQKLEQAWLPGSTRARYLFVWAKKEDGTVSKQFPMEKIHKRHGFRWIHPVHEVLRYDGPEPEKVVWVPGMVLNHYPDPKKSRGQYLSLLELSVAENPDDDRTMFWLGREYMYYQKYDQCIQTLKKHLTMPSAKWEEERSASMRFIAQSYAAKNNIKEAKSWLFRAVAECPGIREPYLYLAKLGYEQADWPLSFAMAHMGLSVLNPSGSYLVEPASWGGALYDYGAIAAYRLGLYDKAYELAKQACSLAPADERLKNNLELIRKKGRFDETP